jgi:hypothetical protein
MYMYSTFIQQCIFILESTCYVLLKPTLYCSNLYSNENQSLIQTASAKLILLALEQILQSRDHGLSHPEDLALKSSAITHNISFNCYMYFKFLFVMQCNKLLMRTVPIDPHVSSTLL